MFYFAVHRESQGFVWGIFGDHMPFWDTKKETFAKCFVVIHGTYTSAKFKSLTPNPGVRLCG